ncbi:type 2 GTP cyclohydrolase I [Rosenbergiella australiborealis]|uniref:Type 2 GTP cyclohydrolase I n=2 Tax=Rosenbergiella TaxID=1356488 RepID=A0ABS5T3X3_9GAMM|nr:type 2 GTP cyclohydrolase I [Rosenbergiella australiborealis]MBT0727060.1 type 2 GTP cyclohydrolase I [Rosenbergiella australiborealis]
MKNTLLEQHIDGYLNSHQFKDYAPNGLQVEGRESVKRIVTGVTACQALLDRAVELEADAIIVHHGYFWKNEPVVIKNMKRQRLKTLLANDINLYGWHLPLDAHPEVGNNVQLAKLLGITLKGEIEPYLLEGEFEKPLTAEQLSQRLAEKLQRQPLYCGPDDQAEIKRIAWCTGGAQDFIERAADAGVDAFITGEVSERTVHIARERGIHFFGAGHHATERGGIQALGEWLKRHHGLEVTFIDIENPV